MESIYILTVPLYIADPQMSLKIRVERIEFDSEQCSLRLNGRNVSENEHVKMGQYHTLDIEREHPFSLEKECWDSVYLQQLDEACDPSSKAELAAVVMQEGLANLCLITSAMTLIKATVQHNVTKRNHVSTYNKFFNTNTCVYTGNSSISIPVHIYLFVCVCLCMWSL